MRQNNVEKEMKGLREQMNLKQAQVASFVGVDHSCLSKVKADEQRGVIHV